MFDIGAAELLVIIIVAVVVIGPKDLPLAMRVAGRWIGKVRRISAQFRSGIDTMVREAELEDMEKKWKAQNEEIMRRSAALTEAEAKAASDAPVMTGPPPVETAAIETPPEAPVAADTPPPAPPPGQRVATVTVGQPAPDLDPPPVPRESILPAKPHTGTDDVQG
jgi:sec-independent protein translocase protein TatB